MVVLAVIVTGLRIGSVIWVVSTLPHGMFIDIIPPRKSVDPGIELLCNKLLSAYWYFLLMLSKDGSPSCRFMKVFQFR